MTDAAELKKLVKQLQSASTDVVRMIFPMVSPSIPFIF